MTEFNITKVSIFDYHTPWDTIVIPVNCVGVMGAGLAKQCREILPEETLEYLNTCDKELIRLGYPRWSAARTRRQNPARRWVVWFPTKNHWQDHSEIDWIKIGLRRLASQQYGFDATQAYSSYPIGARRIAIPPLGAGLGKLKRSEVNDLIRESLRHSNFHQVTLFER